MRFEDDEEIEWTGWNPSAEQLAQYTQREHEHARANIRALRETHGVHAMKPENTLHSDDTYFAAFQAELAQ